MSFRQVTKIYFSPTKTTSTITGRIADKFGASAQISLSKEPDDLQFRESDVVIAGMPVFAGRIPGVAKQRLMKIKGNKTPAIAVVVYGNRAYEDALLELQNTLEQNGFIVVAAAAFIARHSLFASVAADRPDARDLEIIDDFALKSSDKIEAGNFVSVSVPGNFPYKDVSPFPLIPTANEKCVSCAKCAEVCPVGAITREKPQETKASQCISCAACVFACPEHARSFKGAVFERAQTMILPKCVNYLEPEIFI